MIESGSRAATAVERLVQVMDRLRSPGGCEWDAVQTHASLVEYLVEETFEVIEAIDAGDPVDLREELGDLLLQVVFHARIGEEWPTEPWGLAEVATGISDKLIRRHPHVFGDDHAPDAEMAEHRWQERKAAEKERRSATDGVPMAMPGLPLAHKLVRRARRAGLEVTAGSARARAEAERVLDDTEPGSIGEFVLALVAGAIERGIDVDAELRQAVRGFRQAVIDAEGSESAHADGDGGG